MATRKVLQVRLIAATNDSAAMIQVLTEVEDGIARQPKKYVFEYDQLPAGVQDRIDSLIADAETAIDNRDPLP